MPRNNRIMRTLYAEAEENKRPYENLCLADLRGYKDQPHQVMFQLVRRVEAETCELEYSNLTLIPTVRISFLFGKLFQL